jgi:hypothetical protein
MGIADLIAIVAAATFASLVVLAVSRLVRN